MRKHAASFPSRTQVSFAPPIPTPTMAGWQARPRLPDSIRVSTKKRLMPATPSPGKSMRKSLPKSPPLCTVVTSIHSAPGSTV